MKFRTGFVSNSSSSSFVLASKTKDPTPTIKMEIEFELNEIIDEEIKTVDELNRYFISKHGWRESTIEEVLENNEFFRDDYNDYITKLKEGYTLYFGSLSNEDDPLGAYLYSQGLPKIKEFEILEEGN